MRGRVKSFNEDRGFGFIRGEDTKEYFVHITDVMTDQPIFRGRMVEFSPDINDKGYVARNVFLCELDARQPVFVEFGNVRIKLSNIKNYGIATTPTCYAKVFERYPYEYSKNTLFGEKQVKTYGFVDTGERIRLDSYEVREMNARVFRFQNDYYYRYVRENGKIEKVLPPDIKMGCFEDSIERKNVEYLYVTTYQNDNYRFVEDLVEFDIHKKCKELDEYKR